MKTIVYLSSLTISGIKNIEKEIRLDFYKKTIDKNFNPEDYKVKAIYGENGSGKTGIVTAVYILREILVNSHYLNESSNQVFLGEIVNKKTHYLHMECEFIIKNSQEMHMYEYKVDLTNVNRERFEIVSEMLSHKVVLSKNSKYDIIFACQDGELIISKTAESFQDELKGITANLLKTSTFSTISLPYFLDHSSETEKMQFGSHIIKLLVLGLSLIVSLESEDQHITYLIQESAKEDNADPKSLLNILNLIYDRKSSYNAGQIRIHKKNYSEYRNKIKQMESFLQLFKTDIKSIDIDKKEDKDYYECRLLVDYGGYTVDTEFESTGIKKLIRIFDALQGAANGQIVFIDEMDSNINDVYLCKLIEYLMLYGKGQLCFTTHNTSPMTELRNGKKSIDFLSNDNFIVSWSTNGNYKPENLYKQGLIKYLPFNIEPEDFIGVLGE